MTDRLQSLLDRALHRASLAKQAELKQSLLRKQAHRLADARVISEDYTSRLQDRATFRRLLADDTLDAARFRWYFTHYGPSQTLDQLRKWIDQQMEKQ